MDNGHDGSNSKGVCEKIFSTLCPNFQSNHHAHHKQDPIHGSAAPNTAPPTHDHTFYSNNIQIKLGDEAAAIEMARMPKAAMVRPTKVYGERQHPVTMRMDSQVEKDSKTPGLDKSDTFSDYINRTKIKIRASVSNVDMERVSSRADYVYETEKEDNGKDVFSDFVNRAKIKIRKTSSIGSRRNISFKE